MGRVRVGVSGWSYPRWRGDFYPRGLPQRAELGYAAERFGTVEVNGSFYSLQRPTTYAGWREAVPGDFVLALKGGRFITHQKKLRDVEVPLANFWASGPLALGPTLGPVLWQLPASLRFDAERMASFFDLLPRSTAEAARAAEGHDDKVPEDRALTTSERDLPVHHVLEARHPSFAEPDALALLRDHGIGCVVADSGGVWLEIDAVTSDVVYVRLHGHTELYTSGYAPASLDRWADRCRAWAADADVYVYFDNDARGRAPYDATSLIERLGD